MGDQHQHGRHPSEQRWVPFGGRLVARARQTRSSCSIVSTCAVCMSNCISHPVVMSRYLPTPGRCGTERVV
eukprot:scaffold15742_cov178-Skeletonema_marinoi.AAC.13